MNLSSRTALTALALVALSTSVAPSSAAAQRRVQYDTISEMTPAQVSCGFCAGEAFGTLFRPLGDGSRGLRADEFPLTLSSIELVVTRTAVDDSFQCNPTGATGNVALEIEAYAGVTPPTNIRSFPLPGQPWPGETLVYAMSSQVPLSTEEPRGSRRFNLMFAQIDTMNAPVAAPNTYIRVSVKIPAGGSSGSCAFLGFEAPNAVPIRDDDGRIEPRVGFIYAVGGFGDPGWYWNEDSDGGVNGDWGVRINVRPNGAPTPDAGTPSPDAGSSGADAGQTGADGGAPPPRDGGGTAADAGGTPTTDAGRSFECDRDAQCEGGERCIEGGCQVIACSAARDCGGGRTCVDGTCRNLCSSSAECLGGEVCDTVAGSCATAESREGCSCRIGARSRGGRGAMALGLLAALGAAMRRRHRVASGPDAPEHRAL